jgi:hypothetical protein
MVCVSGDAMRLDLPVSFGRGLRPTHAKTGVAEGTSGIRNGREEG